MPRIPESNRRVGTITTGPTSAAKLDVAVPRAWGNFGNTLMGIGEVLKKRQEEIISERNEAMAQEALNNFKRDLIAKEAEWKTEKRGKEAFGLGKESEKWVEEKAREYSLSIGNADAYDMFKKASETAKGNFIASIYGYEVTEDRNYKIAVAEDSISGYKDDLTRNPLNIQTSISKANLLIDKYMGGNPEKKRQVEYEMYSTVAENLLNKKTIQELDLAKNQWDLIKENIENKNFVSNVDNKFTTVRDAIIKKNEKDQNDLEKKLHDTEEENLGKLFIAEDYVGALRALQNAKWLNGDELRIWKSAIDEADEEDNRWMRTDPEIEAIIVKNLGDWSDDEIKAFMGNGLSVGKTMSYLQSNRQPTEEDLKLTTPEAKKGYELLKYALDRAIFLPDVEFDEEMTDAEALENRTIYMNMLDEYKKRLQDPENKKSPQDIINEMLEPYMEKKSNQFWSNMVSYYTGIFEKIGKTVKPIAKDLLGTNEEDPKRQQAIDILNSNGKLVNEETIKQVMDQL